MITFYNKFTFEKLTFNVNAITGTRSHQKSKYDSDVNENIQLNISEAAIEAIHNDIRLQLGPDWTETPIPEWQADDMPADPVTGFEGAVFTHRVSVNKEQRDIIADQAPEFYVELNQNFRNPRFKHGDVWEVYVTKITPEANILLNQIGAIVKTKSELTA